MDDYHHFNWQHCNYKSSATSDAKYSDILRLFWSFVSRYFQKLFFVRFCREILNFSCILAMDYHQQPYEFWFFISLFSETAIWQRCSQRKIKTFAILFWYSNTLCISFLISVRLERRDRFPRPAMAVSIIFAIQYWRNPSRFTVELGCGDERRWRLEARMEPKRSMERTVMLGYWTVVGYWPNTYTSPNHH